MLATLVTRICQLLFTAIVLGISIHAVHWQLVGKAPATTAYNAFAGALGLVTALVGLAAIWISAIPELIMAAVDALTSVLLLAGGIALAVGLHGVSCSFADDNYGAAFDNQLLNGGCEGSAKGMYCGFDMSKPAADLRSRCHAIEADTAFLFLSFLTCIAAAVLCFMAHKRGGGVKHTAV